MKDKDKKRRKSALKGIYDMAIKKMAEKKPKKDDDDEYGKTIPDTADKPGITIKIG